MIETRKLTKRYGDLIAVNEINLTLAEGDVFGFIGPNGSGKTTTMRMIATLLARGRRRGRRVWRRPLIQNRQYRVRRARR